MSRYFQQNCEYVLDQSGWVFYSSLFRGVPDGNERPTNDDKMLETKLQIPEKRNKSLQPEAI
eukprot:3488469-Amphidinium_carterae.1